MSESQEIPNTEQASGLVVSPEIAGDAGKIILERVSLAGATSFEREGFDGHIYVDTPDLKMLQVDVHGRHPRKRMVSGVRTYTVLDGEGTFTLGDETYSVNKGDLFVIPEGGEYEYEGLMTLFEANASTNGLIQDEKIQ